MVLPFKKAEDLPINLKCVIMGCSGAGKSFAIGTLLGKTLILTTRNELHGVYSASLSSKDVYYVCIDKKEEGDEDKKFNDGDPLPPDVALSKFRRTLKSDLSFFDNIGVDSLTDLDLLFRASKEFDTKTRTDKGVHSGFMEPGAVLGFFREIFDTLAELNDKGKNVVCTLAARIRDKDATGKVQDVSPVLSTYGVAEDIPRAFPQVLLLDEAEKEENGEVVKKRVFSFDASYQRASKDQTGAIKKAFNYSPRLVGVSDEDTPAAMPADLNKVLELIRKKGKRV